MTSRVARRPRGARSRVAVVLLAARSPRCSPPPQRLAAQAVKGTLLGTVSDAQGAAVPGATVTVTETGTNIARTAPTNASGHYIFANLKDGIYRVVVEMPGLPEGPARRRRGGRQHHRARGRHPRGRRAHRGGDGRGGDAAPADRPRRHRPDHREQADHRDAALLQPQLPGAAGHGARSHAALPSALAVLQLAGQPLDQRQRAVAPGQQRDARRHRQQPQDGPAHRAHPVRGRHRVGQRQHEQLRRRVRPRGRRRHQRHPEVGDEPAQGRRLLLRQRRQHAGQGLLLRARRPDTSYKQFGAALGGPIVKNKLFFFADYQGTRDNLGNVFRHNIPPADFRNGDFSRATTIIYDPATGNPDGTGRQPFPGNIIPANRISPIARNLLAFLPAPNVRGAPSARTTTSSPACARRRRRPSTSS